MSPSKSPLADCTEEEIRALARLSFGIASCDSTFLKSAIENCQSLQLKAGAMTECLLQAIPYSGFPGVIEAFSLWQEIESKLDAGKQPVAEEDCTDTNRSPEQIADPQGLHKLAAGREIFEQVYGKQTDRVLGQLLQFHPQLEKSILSFAYGEIMGRAKSELSALEQFGVASLLAQGRLAPLYSHMRGALRQACSSEALSALLRSFEADIPSERLEAALGVLKKLESTRSS